MRYYLNEASLQGQFEDDTAFRNLLDALLSARTRSPLLSAMRTTGALADRPVSGTRNVREVVQSWRGSSTSKAFLAWVGRNGPFIEEDRLPEADDFFHCFGIDVTDGGLGEAARRVKAGEVVASVSFPGGINDFAKSLLEVVQGLEEDPIASYKVDNFWDAADLLNSAHRFAEPAGNWRSMIEAGRCRFPHLMLPDSIWEHPRLAREPFDAVIRDRFYALLDHLNTYMSGRNADGSEGPVAQEVVHAHFHGDRALFSPESQTNRTDFRAEMTFANPGEGGEIFAHWHGKISHRYFRLHFEWPVPPGGTRLKVLYVGPKLTKS